MNCEPLWVYLRRLENIVCEKVNEADLCYTVESFEKNREKVTRKGLRSGLRKGNQSRGVAMARYICSFILLHHGGHYQLTGPKIARLYLRDHSTIYYGVEKLGYLFRSSPHCIESRVYSAVMKELKLD